MAPEHNDQAAIDAAEQILTQSQEQRQECVAALGDMILPIMGWDGIVPHLHKLHPRQRWLVWAWYQICVLSRSK